MFEKDTPVVGTSTREIAPVVRGKVVIAEREQMRSRVSYFVFRKYYDPAVVPSVPPCLRCFAEWLLAAERALAGTPPRPLQPPPPDEFAADADVPGGTPRGAGRRWRGQRRRRREWETKLGKGEYTRDDSGGCFCCGDPEHDVRDCTLVSADDSDGSSRSPSPPPASACAPMKARRAPGGGRAGAAKRARRTPGSECTTCGSTGHVGGSCRRSAGVAALWNPSGSVSSAGPSGRVCENCGAPRQGTPFCGGCGLPC